MNKFSAFIGLQAEINNQTQVINPKMKVLFEMEKWGRKKIIWQTKAIEVYGRVIQALVMN